MRMAENPYRDESTLRELYIEKRLSTVEIAEQLDCGSTTVNNWLERHGIERRNVKEARAEGSKKKNQEERNRAGEMYEDGMSPPEIARKMGRHEQTVRSWIKQLGIKREEIECPTCGDMFPNENGMKVHHAKSHDESIRGKIETCDNCGEETRTRNRDMDHTFCDQDCFGEWFGERISGEGHFDYSQVEFSCDNCGETQMRRGGQLEKFEHNFCSTECMGEWSEENRQYPKDPESYTNVECEWCGDSFDKYKSKAKRVDTHFCDWDCYTEWFKRNCRGEDSPVWKGGYEEYYGPSWLEQREKARERADYSCEVCGATKEELGQMPDCHHIERFGNYGVENHEEANRLENLILMCRSCHMTWEHLPVTPDRR